MTSGLLAKAAEEGHTFSALAKPVHPLELLERLGPLTPSIDAN